MFRLLFRSVPVCLFLFLSVALAFAEEGHRVTIVKAGNGMLTCTDGGGNPHVVKVAADARITNDGKTCKLEDLRPDQQATVMGRRVGDEKVITSIEARTR